MSGPNPPDDSEREVLTNAKARDDTIVMAVRELARMEAEAKAINAEIREFKQVHIKGDLGFKLADWNAVYRVSQLEVEDRDQLLDTLREGFQALGVGGSLDWVAAAEGEPQPAAALAAPKRRRQEPAVARSTPTSGATGKADGLAGHFDHAARWPEGDVGHAAYQLGHAEGERRTSCRQRQRRRPRAGSCTGGASARAGPAAEEARARPDRGRRRSHPALGPARRGPGRLAGLSRLAPVGIET